MLSAPVLEHLRYEMSRPDPWSFQANPFEQRRYDLLRRFVNDCAQRDSALEIGCANGLLTDFVASRWRRVRAVDALPEAIELCRLRLQSHENIQYDVSDIAECAGWQETYDLMIVSEVLYYLGEPTCVQQTIRKLTPWVRRGGSVIFCSARDEVSARWGLPAGAETAMAEWEAVFKEVSRTQCVGSTPDEDCIVVRYQTR